MKNPAKWLFQFFQHSQSLGHMPFGLHLQIDYVDYPPHAIGYLSSFSGKQSKKAGRHAKYLAHLIAFIAGRHERKLVCFRKFSVVSIDCVQIPMLVVPA